MSFLSNTKKGSVCHVYYNKNMYKYLNGAYIQKKRQTIHMI